MKYKYQSQIGQDQYYIENVIKGRRNGRFLDIGANDGVTMSNTYVLETELGWTGVCVEANPDLIPKLIENRPNSEVFEAVLWNYRTKVKFAVPSNQDTMLSRVDGIGINAGYFTEEFTPEPTVRTVRTNKLSNLLRGPQHFDYCSLDVEGAELHVLRGVDWTRTTFGYLAIEHGNREGYLNEIITFLAPLGYRVHRMNQFDVDFVPYRQRR